MSTEDDPRRRVRDALDAAEIVALPEGDAPALEAPPNGWTGYKSTDMPPGSDEALALRFAEIHQWSLRYVAAWNQWLAWDGMRWVPDSTLLAVDRVRRLCEDEAAGADGATGKKIASNAVVRAVEQLARADRRLAATVEQWDADPWLLNTPGGVVDLRTGGSRQARPSDYMTRITAALQMQTAMPIWSRVVREVTGGDEELQFYLQRMAGYCLTGCTTEHALFFAYGTGSNGKTVVLNTLQGVMGSYHQSAPIQTFTGTPEDRHPTELAGLRGARLVTAVETEEGRRWAESRVKALTGGEKIAARFMRQDFFEFWPVFKLIVSGNHKPGLRSVDEAMRRRFHLIPFSVTIPEERRDPDLLEKLEAEWPAILHWMIQGCLAWRECGLSRSSSVAAATAEYLRDEDALTTWIDEACERRADHWTGTSELFAAWRAWATRNGEFPGRVRKFVNDLEARGFRSHRQKIGRGIIGLRLLDPHEMEEDDTPDPYNPSPYDQV